MENVLLIDYLTLSSKILNEYGIIELFGLQDCEWEVGKACNGYRDALWFESIKVLYNGSREDMGVCIELTGQGCRAFETYGHGDYGRIFDEVRSEPLCYNISRLDVAFDDLSGIFDFDRLASDTRANAYVSRFGQYSVTEGNAERIIYHGSKKSDVLIRIYDKALEKNKPEEHWIRFELQLRRDKALNMAKMYDTINQSFYGVVFNYLRYIERTDENISRCPMTDYWQAFLGAAQRIMLTTNLGVEYNLGNLNNFVIHQAGNAIDTFIKIYGEEDFIEQLHNRDSKMSEKYVRLVERWAT